MDIQFVEPGRVVSAKTAVARVVFEGDTHGGALAQAVAASRFTGAKGQTLDILAPQGLDAARLVLVGAGKREVFTALGAEHAAATGYNVVKASGLTTLRVEILGAGDLAAHAALGVRLAAYRFDKYRTKEAADKKPSINRVEITASDADGALAALTPLSALADGMTFTRDLVSEPPNVLYPVEFARRVKALESLGLEVEILGEPEMMKLGMGSLLAVGQGSLRESQLAIIKWYGAADKSAQPIAPAENMEDMKWDMGGAGTVAGLMHALAGRKAKVNAIGILGLVENMPDGNAYRPGDVLTSMSGQTIEVVNTDAEGRLVLADALWYCQDRFKPKFMVDLATLTGAIIVALGEGFAGCYANNEDLAANLLAAAGAEDEGLWRMPLPDAYNRQIESMIADMKNTGGRPGGSITAALFLKRYVNDVPWAHLDIAGTAWKKPSNSPTSPDGATGYGVRLLNRMVQDRYEG